MAESGHPFRCLLANAVDKLATQGRAALDPLYSYDEDHGGDLVRTLAMYLALGCNASRCAQVLCLHRSGLLYRLARIEDLLSVDLDSFYDRVALEIAIVATHEELPYS